MHVRTSDAVTVQLENGETVELDHGHVVIAAITSCTNTSNPSVMLGAGLVAKKAVERGLRRQPWVKTSLAPGSTVVTEYLEKSGLDEYLDKLQFNLVGYGCTTCIGNSGPLPEEISKAVNENDLVVCSVLSGNRNFEGRINPDTRANYLASPPLVVAYALAGRMDIDLNNDPLGKDSEDEPVYLSDIWPSNDEIKRGHRATPSEPTCSPRAMRTSSPATSAGAESRCPRANATPGPTPPMSASPPSSRECPRSQSRWSRSRAPGFSRCWATPSPRTTSLPRGRSRRTAPQGSG